MLELLIESEQPLHTVTCSVFHHIGVLSCEYKEGGRYQHVPPTSKGIPFSLQVYSVTVMSDYDIMIDPYGHCSGSR